MREREYDLANNEGYADGYNPYREARIERELQAEIARPKSIWERKDAIWRRLNTLDCEALRDAHRGEIASLRADLQALEAEDLAVFLAVWTLDETKRRRADWNARVKAGIVTSQNATKVQQDQGWWIRDLRRAITHYGL